MASRKRARDTNMASIEELREIENLVNILHTFENEFGRNFSLSEISDWNPDEKGNLEVGDFRLFNEVTFPFIPKNVRIKIVFAFWEPIGNSSDAPGGAVSLTAAEHRGFWIQLSVLKVPFSFKISWHPKSLEDRGYLRPTPGKLTVQIAAVCDGSKNILEQPLDFNTDLKNLEAAIAAVIQKFGCMYCLAETKPAGNCQTFVKELAKQLIGNMQEGDTCSNMEGMKHLSESYSQDAISVISDTTLDTIAVPVTSVAKSARRARQALTSAVFGAVRNICTSPTDEGEREPKQARHK